MIGGGLSGGVFTLIAAFFSALLDGLLKLPDWRFKVKPFIVKYGPSIANMLTAIGYIFTVVDIVANKSLTPVQKSLEILTWLGATIALLQVAAPIMAFFGPFAGVFAVIGIFLLITWLALLLISLIENHAIMWQMENKKPLTC